MMTSSDYQRVAASNQLLGNCSNWSLGFDFLLDDPQGIKAFESFLKIEECIAYLEFLWACEGMKNIGTNEMYLRQIINCIYKNYIENGRLCNTLTETAINALKMCIEEKIVNVDIFNELEVQVVLHLKINMYPKFLKSSTFLMINEGFQSTFTPTYEDVSLSDINDKISKIVEWRKSTQNQYGRKIVFVLNNDDLPVHQTFTTSLRDRKPQVKEPDEFVRELTEKLEMLKFKQDHREGKQLESGAVWRKASHKHFCSKLSNALHEILKNEDLPTYSNYSQEEEDKRSQEQAVCKELSNNGNEFKALPTRKNRLTKYFRSTIWKHKKKSKTIKMPNSMSCPTGSLKQPDTKSKQGQSFHIRKQLRKSRSLNFGDSGLELSDALMSEASEEQPCSLSKPSKNYALSLQRIQSWINDCQAGFSNDDEKRILV